MRLFHFFIYALLLQTVVAYSSDVDVALKKANKEYDNDHYHNAIPLFEDVLKLDANNAEAYYKAGICYLETASLPKALEYIEKAYQIDPEVDKYYKYWHGKALHRNYKFEEAIEEYEYFLGEFNRRGDSRRIEIETLISQAKVGKELYDRPQYFLIQNAGSVVNSEFHDHSPIVANNGNMLIFTSQREYSNHHAQDPDGHYYEAIFISEKKNGEWQEPYSISQNLESAGHDACIQLFDNDTKMLIYKQSHYGDIYVSELKDGKWGVPVRAEDINSNDYEADATITSDGQRIYFSTDKYTKDKNLDLFYSDRTPDGGWTKPEALPGSINSAADENAPYISEDGKTLYFCSNGEKSMGGYDIFRSELGADGTWGAPENLGYPINSIDDDVYYHPVPGTRMAYFSSYRIGGLGELDIYNSVPVPIVKLNGKIISSVDNKPVLNDSIEVFFRSKDGAEFEFASNSQLNEGKFDNNLLSHTDYEAIIVKGSDTLFSEDLNIALADEDGTEIEKTFVIDYIDGPKDSVLLAANTLDTITGSSFDNIYFEYNSTELQVSSKKELDKVLRLLKVKEEIRIELAGHTDNVGSQKFNLRLSKKRAKKAYDYLVSNGANKGQLSFVGYGKLKPIVPNDSDENRAKNRRTEIKIIQK